MTPEEWEKFLAEDERQTTELHKARNQSAMLKSLLGLVPSIPFIAIWVIAFLIIS